MNSDNTKLYILASVAIIIGLAAWLMLQPKDMPADYSHITDFHTCQEAGFPVLTSFPATCSLPDGRSFSEDTSENSEVVIENINSGDTITSPFTVQGKARGGWFHEANIPVTLKDQNGKILDQVGAQAIGEWMTEELVPFSATLEFTKPDTQYGILLIEKDNASGLPEYDASYAIPVRFY